ncbi:MAG: hypothetical protein CM1200mP20_05280 [Pseudomonadota bacterium]|nr:MAG: hypothetical protein CM1200mP20_05280 [Pseudomonadota bacterium]
MNADQHFKLVSVSAWCDWHSLDNSGAFGEAVVEAIERSDSRVAILARGRCHTVFKTMAVQNSRCSTSVGSSIAKSTLKCSNCGRRVDSMFLPRCCRNMQSLPG